MFGDAASLPELVLRIGAVLRPLEEPFELLLVLDGGPAEDRRAAQEQAGKASWIRVIDLGRNRGQHTALLCGMAASRGRRVVTLDADLQNPPEEIPRLVACCAEGWDGVFGVPRRKRHGPVRRAGSRLLQALLVPLYGKPRGLVMTNFRVLERRVSDAAVARAGRWPYIQGLLLEAGGRFTNLEVDHQDRRTGKSAYGWPRLAALFTRAILGSPRLPFRLVLGRGRLGPVPPPDVDP